MADVLVARLKGAAPAAPYQGEAVRYIESGGDKVARVNVNFLGGPAPTAVFSPPSDEGTAEKRLFGASRRSRWFGH